MSETTAQKTARLRALRYARDGSPDERKAAAKHVAQIRQQVKTAAINMFFAELHSAVKAQDDNKITRMTGIVFPAKR